jgi:hypothetical protein
VGRNYGTLSNCFATGTVTGDWYVGGLMGWGYESVISNCYATGTVTGDNYVGGFTGYDSGGSYTSCFWNSDIGPAQSIGNTTDPNVMSRTTAQMQTQSTFTDYGWDFVSESTNGTDNYWRLCIDGIKYPKLACQSITGDLTCPAGVDLVDFSFFAGRWLETGCDTSNNCGRADMDFSTDVGGGDLLLLTDNWLADWGWGSISVEDYIDKMKGGWVGQMVGVSWGAPTEFGWMGEIIPEGAVPVWESWMINDAFWQDDIYVEMTFLRSLELYGLGVPMSQAGSDFANSSYMLWHANYWGRDNLRSGVMPGDSGHPAYNGHADDIDYQIEADYSGLISPGLPNTVIGLGEKFGRLMNYGDGLYGGQFVGGMYAEAFFETDMETIVRAGLECIPVGSQYHECISDVLTWYGANPNWEDTWLLVNNKYHLNPDYRRFSCDTGAFNIDAKINGAYIAMGLLYGNGDPNDTITISMRCGQDSDCNPSNAAGILFTSMGYSNVPSRFKSALDEGTYFSYTDYNFPLLMGVCESLARQAVVQAGGSIEDDPCNPGEEIFVVPVSSPAPSALLQSWDPDPPIPTDTAPSYVTITSPANGDSFVEAETITIEVYAVDDGTVQKVEFFDGVSKIGEDLTEPFSFGWVGASVGQHSLKARATDNDDKTTTSVAVNITVTPAGVPYVVITSPSNGNSFDEGEMITITADACDVDGSIIKVEFFDGVSKLGEDTTEPYSFGWAGATAGQHSLKAKATDNDDWTTTSVAVNIAVCNPPAVSGIWRSFDVVMTPTSSPQAMVTDGNDVTAEIEFYESANDNGVNMGILFDVYNEGEHGEDFNHAEHVWAFDTGWDPYPYAAKSTVGRGSDGGEGNTPTPLGVFDLQLHPPDTEHLTVAAFIVPEAGNYSVYDLAVRRVHNEGGPAGYRVFDSAKNLLTHITASTNQDWVTDPATYNLGALQAGDRIYFATDQEVEFGWDATEIIWTIEEN